MIKIRRGNKDDKKDYLKSQLEAFPNEDKGRHSKYFNQKIDICY